MKITIRSIEPSDFEAVKRVYEAPKAIAGTVQMPYPSAESWRTRLANPSDDRFTLVAEIDDEIVGVATLGVITRPRRRHVGQIGMGVHDAWHGKGVGTALMKALMDIADNWVNLRRVELTVFTDNEPAVALYQKFGFEIEGTLRDHAFRDGAYVDAYHMARLKR